MSDTTSSKRSSPIRPSRAGKGFITALSTRRSRGEEQLTAIGACQLAPQPIGLSLHGWLAALQEIESVYPGYRVLAMVALSSVLRPLGNGSQDQKARDALARKTLDLAIFDAAGNIVLAIGVYDDSGPSTRATIRSAALAAGAIPELDISPGMTEADVFDRVVGVLGLPDEPAGPH